MAKQLPDITYIKNKYTPIIDSPKSYYQIPYFKDYEYFANWDSYNAFVKECEKVVRNHDRYKKYKSYLMSEVRLNHCQVLSNLDDNDCKIEMHHGPIFTLFDYCSIVLEYFLLRKWKINTFRIADVVLTEHQKNHVQIVMLSSTIHQEVHARDLFINYRHAYGDLNAFIRKYGVAFLPEHKEKLNRYIDKSLMVDSTDNGLLKLNKYLYEKE